MNEMCSFERCGIGCVRQPDLGFLRTIQNNCKPAYDEHEKGVEKRSDHHLAAFLTQEILEHLLPGALQ